MLLLEAREYKSFKALKQRMDEGKTDVSISTFVKNKKNQLKGG